MRKITKEAGRAFLNGYAYKKSNTVVENNTMKLFGNRIAWCQQDGIYIQAVFDSFKRMGNTTRERLSTVMGVNSLFTKKGIVYLNGQEWDGSAICVFKWK